MCAILGEGIPVGWNEQHITFWDVLAKLLKDVKSTSQIRPAWLLS